MKDRNNEIKSWKIDDYNLIIKHPDKLYWPEENIRKLDLLNYYKKISEIILPYFKDRPVTLHCFPAGIHGFSFYRRDITPESSIPVNTKIYHEITKEKAIHIPLIDSSAGLLWFANKGCYEFHLWSSTTKHFNKPDILIFDLDIHKTTHFKTVLQTAIIIREELKKSGLRSFAKTSGGTGMHLFVPIIPENSFDEVRRWLKLFVEKLEEDYPNLISSKRKNRKTHIGHHVIIDILQNVISRNTAAPYTVRAFPGAPVSAPLSWEEITDGGFIPADFNINNMISRIEKKGDLFSGVLTHRQKLDLHVEF